MGLKIKKVLKGLNPVRAIIEKAAPNSKVVKLANKVQNFTKKYNPTNILFDVTRGLGASSINIANRVLTGNKTSKAINIKGGKSFLASKIQKSVHQGDNWLTTSKVGRVATTVGAGAVAIVGTVIPPVGIAAAAASAALMARNKISDKQVEKKEMQQIQMDSVNSMPTSSELLQSAKSETYQMSSPFPNRSKFIVWLLS